MSAIDPKLSLDQVRSVAANLLAPGHFFLVPDAAIEYEHVPAETSSWEIFRGRLLDPRHTRQTATFEAWNVYLREQGERSGEPLLSLKLDAPAGRLHVVRGLLCYVWEGYDSGGNVILSRETTRWVRELSGTVFLSEFVTAAELPDELASQVHHAVVGASRLPLTSVEAPLPGYTLGRLAWCYQPMPGADEKPATTWTEFLDRTAPVAMDASARAKLLQTFLLSASDSAELAARLPTFTLDPLGLLATLFNEVSLSPWTHLTDRTLALLRALEEQGTIAPADSLDFLCRLVVQISRHLTAYDLIKFHHRGANYPDALLLDVVLKHLFAVIERSPQMFHGADQRRRRRALRMGCLLRRSYEGLPVPESPTSPGENNRVWPVEYARVSEEQILHPGKRPRRLYDGDPLANHLSDPVRRLLKMSLEDLQLPSERRELGLALYLDRPLGVGKSPGEPDRTILLSHLAFSRTIAQGRLRLLAEHFELDLAPIARLLEADAVAGVPLSELGGTLRPGAVSIADARQAADDFVFLRTTAATTAELFAQFDFAPLRQRFRLEEVCSGRGLLIVPRGGEGTLTIHDAQHRPRVELAVDVSAGFGRRAGREFPRAGLRVMRVWEDGCESARTLDTGIHVGLPPR